MSWTVEFANIACAACALIAAGLWFLSARVKTPSGFSVQVVTVHASSAEFPGSEIVGEGFGTSDDLNALGRALIRQSRLSAWAAAFAGVAAILQAGATVAQHFGKAAG